MSKKYAIASLALVGLLGFFLIVLQYKVTELSLEIPPLEEGYHQKKERIAALELELCLLKSPKRLLVSEAQSALVFPKHDQVIALSLQPQPLQRVESVPVAPYLPLAKVFP